MFISLSDSTTDAIKKFANRRENKDTNVTIVPKLITIVCKLGGDTLLSRERDATASDRKVVNVMMNPTIY